MRRFLWIIALFSGVAIAAAPIIWESGEYGKFLTSLGFKFDDGKEVRTIDTDPTSGAGVAAPIGSLALEDDSGTGRFWFKLTSGDTGWTNVLTGGSAWSLFGNAGLTPGTGAGESYLGTSDAVDLIFATDDTERFRITSTGALDTTLGAGILHSDASGVLTSSAIVNSDVDASAAIDATKIHDGSVSNTEYGYLDGVTSAIQTQLDDKASLALDNLASVAINTDLIPDASLSHDLGSAAARWAQGYINELYTGTIRNAGGDLVWNTSTNLMQDTSASASIDLDNRQLRSGATVKVDWSGSDVVISDLDATNIEAEGSGGLVLKNSSGGTALTIGAGGGTQTVSSGSFEVDGNFYLEDTGAGTNRILITPPSPLGAEYTLTLPADGGTSGYVMTTDGSGGLSFTDPTGLESDTDLQEAYSNGADGEIVVTSGIGGIRIEDAASPIGADLFSVTDNGDSTEFLKVDANGITASAATIGSLDGVVKASSGALSASDVDLTSEVTGVLPLANGGTEKALTAVNGGLVYTDADSMEVLAAGADRQLLSTDGSGGLSWQDKEQLDGYVINPSCTVDASNITDADGIVTRNTTTPLTSTADCAIDADAAAEFAEWTSDTFEAFNEGQNCEASMFYSGDATDYDFEVYINTTEVNSESLLDASSEPRKISLNFPCGSLANNPEIRITATDNAAAAINVAKLYIGPATNVGSVAQAEVIVSARRLSGNQTIGSASPTTIIFDSTASSSAFEGANIGGQYNTSTGIFTAAYDADYIVSFGAQLSSATANETFALLAEVNGNPLCSARELEGNTTKHISSVDCYVSLSTGDTLEITSDSASDTSYDIVSTNETRLVMTKIPSQSEQVVKIGNQAPDIASVYLSADVTGINTSATIVFDETKINQGNAYNTSTGEFTCSKKGVIYVEGQVQVENETGAVSSNVRLFINGNTRARAQGFEAPGAASTKIVPFSFSDSCEFGDVVTLVIVSNDTSYNLAGDAIGANQRTFATFSLGAPVQNVPLLKNAVTTSSEGVMRVETGTINCDATPSIITEEGDWLGTPTYTSTGRCSLNFTSGIFSAAPNCFFTLRSPSNVDFQIYRDTNIAKSSTVYGVKITLGSSANNGDFEVMCVGPR